MKLALVCNCKNGKIRLWAPLETETDMYDDNICTVLQSMLGLDKQWVIQCINKTK